MLRAGLCLTLPLRGLAPSLGKLIPDMAQGQVPLGEQGLNPDDFTLVSLGCGVPLLRLLDEVANPLL